MNPYEQTICDYIKHQGFGLGKELNQLLQDKHAVSPENARKIIQRAAESGTVKSSKPITFGNGQFAYFSDFDFLDREMILKITRKHRPPLYRLIKIMEEQDGIVSYYEALKLAAAPLAEGKTKADSLPKLVREMEELGLATLVQDSADIKYLISPDLVAVAESYMTRHRINMQTDAAFIPDIINSLHRFNIIDNRQILYRNKVTPSKGVSHNNFVWDALAYTKTTGINPHIAAQADIIEKQTLVLMDIVIHRPYTDHDFQGFFDRIRSVFNSVKGGERKILPIIVYGETATKKLYNTIHKLGFLTFDLGTFYGSRIYEVVQSLQQLRQGKRNLEKDPGEVGLDFTTLIEQTLTTVRHTGQEINLKNIRGDLFEFLLYPLVDILFPNATIQQGKKLGIIKPEKENYEYDYVVRLGHHNEYVALELKGYSSAAKIPLGNRDTRNTVFWFFGRTLPFAKKLLEKDHGNPKVTGCYITTAGFKEDAIPYLEGLNNSKLKPVGIDTWYDGSKLLQLLDQHKLYKIKSIIEKYYITAASENSAQNDDPF